MLYKDMRGRWYLREPMKKKARSITITVKSDGSFSVTDKDTGRVTKYKSYFTS